MRPRALITRLSRVVTRSSSPTVQATYRIAQRTARAGVNRLTDAQLGWVSQLRSVRWLSATELEIAGWGYERGIGFPDRTPQIEVWLGCGPRRLPAQVEPAVDPEANGRLVNPLFDYANTAFVARFDLAPLLDGPPPTSDERWVVRVAIGDGQQRSSGTLRQRYALGSPLHLYAHPFTDRQLRLAWGRDGLSVTVRQPEVLARDVRVAARRINLELATGLELSGLRMVHPRKAALPAGVSTQTELVTVDLDLHRLVDGSGYQASGEVPVTAGGAASSVEWQLRALRPDGAELAVAYTMDETRVGADRTDTLVPFPGRDGALSVLDAPARVLVERCDLQVGADQEAGVQVNGRVIGQGGLSAVNFVCPRQTLPVTLTVAADGTFSGFAPLITSVWQQPPMPPRVGTYVLRAADGQLALPVTGLPTLLATLPVQEFGRGFRVRTQTGSDRSVRFRVSTPLRAEELGPFHQRRLRQTYRTGQAAPSNAVYFESFYGRAATCNPKALDREIAQRYPQLIRYWGIVDGSVAVPEGAIPVIQGTQDWYHARATARYVVTNDWLRRQFSPQPFQVVLQTWHGSMFKRIGLDRDLPQDTIAKLYKEKSKWDLLLSQNRHSTEILARAYDWDGPILEEGYPRDDVLTNATGEAVRRQLGIPPDKIAVMYAPTWRDNLTEMVTFLDLERLTAALGEDYVILLRGHSRTIDSGASIEAIPGLIDVTTYPEIADLFLAADALVTDYSSVMFDYSVTHRPMLFYVPDLDDYRDSLRGVYFDLSEVAPGPVLYTQDDVVTALRDLPALSTQYAERYDAWRARFNHHDDGHVAERVVRHLLDTNTTTPEPRSSAVSTTVRANDHPQPRPAAVSTTVRAHDHPQPRPAAVSTTVRAHDHPQPRPGSVSTTVRADDHPQPRPGSVSTTVRANDHPQPRPATVSTTVRAHDHPQPRMPAALGASGTRANGPLLGGRDPDRRPDQVVV